jgi:hypothetical protein
LERPWAPAVTILLALVLVSPSLKTGLVADDFIHRLRLDPGRRLAGFEPAPFDLFVFASGQPEQRRHLMEVGLFAWWTAEDFRLAFWRPLSSLSHRLDHRLWPESALLAHAHSLVWFAALLVLVGILYRRLHTPGVAHLALLLYALDDARGVVVGWVSNRNAMIAAVLGVAALWAHDRWRRDRSGAGRVLAPGLFALALLAGESALAVTAYLFAYAVFLDRGPAPRRLLRLWPFAAVTVVWLIAYQLQGYGATGGGIYLSPLDDPLRFLGALVERLPVLLLAQAGGFVSDFWLMLPPSARLAVWGLAVAVLGLAIWLLRPLWRLSPVSRFWSLGALLAAIPVSATFPMDRLLVFVGLGAMATLAMLLSTSFEAVPGPSPAWHRARRLVVPVLVVVHLILAPLLLPARALTTAFLGRAFGVVDASIPSDPTIRDETVVLVRTPADGSAAYGIVSRVALGIPRPRALRVLATGLAEVRVTRLDERTLRVRPRLGFCATEGERMVRGLSRPFRTGDRVALSDLEVRVTEVEPDGRAAEAEFRFARPLEDPALVWKTWQSGRLAPFSLPAIGETRTLPRLGLQDLVP